MFPQSLETSANHQCWSRSPKPSATCLKSLQVTWKIDMIDMTPQKIRWKINLTKKTKKSKLIFLGHIWEYYIDIHNMVPGCSLKVDTKIPYGTPFHPLVNVLPFKFAMFRTLPSCWFYIQLHKYVYNIYI